MKHIIIDPGHGGTAGKDHFRQGPGGEREEWINLMVAKELKIILESKGYISTLTRRKDLEIALQDRVQLAIDSQADFFISIHHASCDPVQPNINFPFFYYHAEKNNAAKAHLIDCFIKEMSKTDHGPTIAYSDHWVFNDGLYVLRETEKNNITAVLTEFSFFSHPQEELKLKTKVYCQLEAQILSECIEQYFKALEFKADVSSHTLFPREYKKQLDTIRKSLLKNGDNSWSENYIKAEKNFNAGQFQDAVINYEKALALNPYHPKIEQHLGKMLICTDKIQSKEYNQNISALLDHIN